MVILKFTGEGEVFYGQSRVGQYGRKFRVLKFATMLKDSPNIGTGTITLKNDPRVLPFGKLLRKTKVNELPQLFNVLKGEMSFIGPRPQTEDCFSGFDAKDQKTIMLMKPGISGIGSLIFRDEEALLANPIDSVELYDHVISPYKGKVECWYYDKASLNMYLLLIFLTLFVVCFPKSKIVWRVISDIPAPPSSIAGSLKYTTHGK